tara:strand:- start:200 stop:532 length:333 start_codon:yes stop_codon:yes gene_type:complete
MANPIPYNVQCALTGEILTEWSQVTPIHQFSKSIKGSRVYFLHIDKTQPEVAELLETIRNAQTTLWEIHNQSPTSLRGKALLEADQEVAESISDGDSMNEMSERDLVEVE